MSLNSVSVILALTQQFGSGKLTTAANTAIALRLRQLAKPASLPAQGNSRSALRERIFTNRATRDAHRDLYRSQETQRNAKVRGYTQLDDLTVSGVKFAADDAADWIYLNRRSAGSVVATEQGLLDATGKLVRRWAPLPPETLGFTTHTPIYYPRARPATPQESPPPPYSSPPPYPGPSSSSEPSVASLTSAVRRR